MNRLYMQFGTGRRMDVLAKWPGSIRHRCNAGGRPRLMPDNDSIEAQQAQLLGRIAAQDSSALSDFYDQTASSLFSFALKMLHDTHDAEEVIQDVFVQIWNKAQSDRKSTRLN